MIELSVRMSRRWKLVWTQEEKEQRSRIDVRDDGAEKIASTCEDR